jgi:hypothetical protein
MEKETNKEIVKDPDTKLPEGVGSFHVSAEYYKGEGPFQWHALKLAEECAELASELITFASKIPEKTDKKAIIQELGQVRAHLTMFMEHDDFKEKVGNWFDVYLTSKKCFMKTKQYLKKYTYTPSTNVNNKSDDSTRI